MKRLAAVGLAAGMLFAGCGSSGDSQGETLPGPEPSHLEQFHEDYPGVPDELAQTIGAVGLTEMDVYETNTHRAYEAQSPTSYVEYEDRGLFVQSGHGSNFILRDCVDTTTFLEGTSIQIDQGAAPEGVRLAMDEADAGREVEVPVDIGVLTPTDSAGLEDIEPIQIDTTPLQPGEDLFAIGYGPSPDTPDLYPHPDVDMPTILGVEPTLENSDYDSWVALTPLENGQPTMANRWAGTILVDEEGHGRGIVQGTVYDDIHSQPSVVGPELAEEWGVPDLAEDQQALYFTPFIDEELEQLLNSQQQLVACAPADTNNQPDTTTTSVFMGGM